MNIHLKNRCLVLALVAAFGLGFVACDEEPLPDNGIGDPCTCEGIGCDAMGVPLPAPIDGLGKIVGCEKVDATGIEGAKAVCLRTIDAKYSALSPTVYAPKGYCSLSAVSAEMENETFKQLVEYGDAASFDKCPEGSALLSSTFDYTILMNAAKITNKTCVKLCRDNSDCNVDGEMECLERKGVKFCYNETNLSISDDLTVTAF